MQQITVLLCIFHEIYVPKFLSRVAAILGIENSPVSSVSNFRLELCQQQKQRSINIAT